MLRFTFLLVALFTQIVVQAQKHQLSLGLGGQKFYDVINYDRVLSNTIIAGYRYSTNSNVFVGTRYYRHSSFSKVLGGKPLGRLTEEQYLLDTTAIGKLQYRDKQYQFFELDAGYRIRFAKRHQVVGFAGPSAAYGNNGYIKKIVLAPGPPYGMGDLINLEFENRKEWAFGGIAGIGYECLVIKNKVSIGAALTGRFYNHDFPFSLHYDLHVGYSL